MAQSQPLLGVGLGNYYDNLPPEKKSFLSLSNWQNKESSIASTNPHDIFAQILSELGFVSLLFYLIMISYFAISDIKILLKQDNFAKAVVISFWSLFLYSLFNPTTTLTYNSLFWVLRALI
jgi:O-antigen ligase